MKEAALSICERNFILNAALQAKRLDGRNLNEFRDLNIYFGNDWGLCYTSLGETRVITQITCEVQQPKTTRPNEGLLFINADVSPMASAHFEPGRSSDLHIHLNRMLEKCIKDSKAVDLESLCLVAEEKVWGLRVDINILNHDGNLVQAASISALAALAHFKRPDVTTDGEDIIIHNITERDPIPLTLHHYPVCINFALLNNGECMLADPTSIEEKISDATLIFGINAYGELCALHLGGSALVEPTLILKCSQKASIKATEIVEHIKKALREDSEARQSNTEFGLVESFHWDKIKSSTDARLKVQLSKFKQTSAENVVDDDVNMTLEKSNLRSKIIDLGDNCAELVSLQGGKSPNPKKFIKIEEREAVVQNQGKVIQLTDVWGVEKIGEGGQSKWESDKYSEDQQMEDSNTCKSKDDSVVVTAESEIIQDAELSGDSEEEEVITLQPEDICNFAETSKSSDTKSKCQQKIQESGTSKTKSCQSRYFKKKNKKKCGKAEK